MARIRLQALPDRTPIKLTVYLTPTQLDALQAYARLYAETYGREESVADLIPAMLAAFLASDRAFVRRPKEKSDA